MVDRRNKPSALASTPGLPPQAQVNISHANSRVTAVLPSGESVEILLYGATVISWKDASGDEKLWLSEGAKLDGSKAVRGGIPLVFPVFGAPPYHTETAKLPQHGFARNSKWEFLGKSTSEGDSDSSSVKLDFGLSSQNLDPKTRSLWGYDFSLIYSVTLSPESLATSIVITNEGTEVFDFHVLLHTYLRIKDITSIKITGLENSDYVDKVDSVKTKTQSGAITITGETDRVYSPEGGASQKVTVHEASSEKYEILRDNLEDVVVWNPWTDKAAGMGDFEPKDGWKNMICVEAGAVAKWYQLEAGDAYECGQTIVLG